jgi:hypothetical protein
MSVSHLSHHVDSGVGPTGQYPTTCGADCSKEGSNGFRRTRSGRDDHMAPGIAAPLDQIADAESSRCGHGKDTTLGAERPHLTEWRARSW